MPAGRKRRSPTWQQSLLLLIAGVVVGYPSCIGASHGMWSGDVSQFRGLYIIAFLAGAMAFLSGFIGFVEIAVRAVTSPIESGTAVAVPRPDHAATDQISTHNVVQRQASLMGSPAAALTRLHVTLAAVVALATMVALRDRGWPALTSSYGRYYGLNRVLTLLLSQLPYAIAFIRTWKVPDRIGLALAVVAGATQVLLTLFTNLQYAASRPDPWPWLSASLGLAAAVLAYLAWRPLLSTKGDVGVLISIFFGFVAYTWLTQISLAILESREQRWISY
jgi:hypothetical protein